MMKEVLNYFWIFILAAFLGYIVETLWCYVRNKKFESRKGLIYEPIVPMYGFSGVIIVLISKLYQAKKLYEIFFIGFLISTNVEFISSIFQEKVFGTKSWDYSNYPLNIGGRVNLIYSILFGLVTLIAYKIILNPFFNFFMKIKINPLIISISIIAIIFVSYDMIISSLAVYRMKERRKNIKRTGKLWNYLDTKYNDELLKKVYANMINV